jgi:hypothetical protein
VLGFVKWAIYKIVAPQEACWFAITVAETQFIGDSKMEPYLENCLD